MVSAIANLIILMVQEHTVATEIHWDGAINSIENHQSIIKLVVL
jgi:hypothetical protein